MALSDMNDLHKKKGAAAVRDAIEAAQPPESISTAPADKQQTAAAAKAKNDSADAFDANGKRVIRHDQGKLPEIVDCLVRALAEADDLNLFVHAGRLSRVYPASEEHNGSVHRPKGTLILHDVDAAHLSECAGRAAGHEKYDGRIDKYRRIDCPRKVTEALLARGHFPELRRLNGFVEAPIVTQDGKLIDCPGYDQNTGLFLAFGDIAGYRRPPKSLNKAKAKQAADLLLKWIEQFPYVSDDDRSAALSMLITSLVRRVLPAAPMFAITAPSAGTGKTLLANTGPVLSTGRVGSVLSLGHDDAEAEKRLGGVLLAGDGAILLDNIERPLSGDLLCQVLTQPSVRLRPLGGSGMASVPTNSLIIATGNNLAVLGDLKRRVALIRLDAGEERPEQRKFSRDHLEDIFANRGALIAAALSIPLAYQSAGSPAIDGLYPLGGFEQWDAMVRRPLVWLGFPDPLLASEGLREQDPDLDAMRQLFGAWESAFGSTPKTVAEIVAAGMDTFMEPNSSGPVHPELRDALQLVCSEKVNSRRLGYWLRAHRDRIIDGMQLVQMGWDGHAKIAKWSIRRCD
jgi:putative DNA primase/helicase